MDKLDLDELEWRLADSQQRIGKMCIEGRPPRMSIPVDRERDDDVFICETLRRCHTLIAEAKQMRAEYQRLLAFLSEGEKQRLENEFGWKARAERAEADNKRLRDELRTALLTIGNLASTAASTGCVHLDLGTCRGEAMAENKRLREALEPFARYAKRCLDKEIPRHIQDDPTTPALASGCAIVDEDGVEVSIADFQRAAAALDRAEAKEAGDV